MISPSTSQVIPRAADSASTIKFRDLDRFFLGLLVLWASRAWFYPGDVETQIGVEAPFLFYFTLACQLLGFYGLFRLGPPRIGSALMSQPLLLALIGWGAVSMAWSSAPYNTFGMVRATLLMMMGCVYFRERLSLSDIVQTFAVVTGLVMVGSLIAAVFFNFGRGTGFHVGSWRGLFSHKNGLGEVSAFATLFFASYILAARRAQLWAALFLSVSTVCLIFSGSANALVTVGSGLALMGLAFVTSKLTPSKITNGLIFIVLAAIAIATTFTLVTVVANSLGRDMTFTGRTRIWEIYLRFAAQQPWTGWGWTTASTNEVMTNLVRTTLKLPYLRSPHSAYVGLAVELGYTGAALYVAWLGKTTVSALLGVARRNDKISILRASIAVGMAVFGFFEVSAGVLPCLWLAFLICTEPKKQVGPGKNARA
ncbi:O-antigen ligase family protein [Caulobacter segnis]